MRDGLLSTIAGAVASAAALVALPAAAETLTLAGVMTGADHQTYREVPFRVPAGTTSVAVEFSYTGKDQKSVIDLGIRDPQRLRGWSGGNKAKFTLTGTWATPSYLPGPLPAGEWKLILGVPNLRKDGRAEYTAKITLDRDPVFHGFSEAPLKTGPGWYRGDLHMHTQHSDGSCASHSGKRIPCPLFRTLEAASARGLDFVAVTDHNTPAHFQDLAELQAYYDDLLLIPGREVTTFHGHANVFGVTAPLDFQLGSAQAPDLNRIIGQVEAAKGVISLNHPGQPSGETCMGCGWTAKTDFARIPAIEAINGINSSGPLSGIPFWTQRLNDGFHVTAVGGSDNHDASLTGLRGVGVPTTVVYAENLGQDAILEGIRKGRVFVDTQGTNDRLLDVTVRAGGKSAVMGETLAYGAARTVDVEVRVVGAAGGQIVVPSSAADDLSRGQTPLAAEETRTLSVDVDHAKWLRVEVRGPDGKLWLLGNPVYLKP
jgi:predicted metal-dependent phosphoesterase TrpH